MADRPPRRSHPAGHRAAGAHRPSRGHERRQSLHPGCRIRRLRHLGRGPPCRPTIGSLVNTSRPSLLRLCNALGEPGRDLVLSAEGNVSCRLDDPAEGSRRMIIKASGCSLAAMTDDDLLLVDRRLISPLLDQPDVTDDITAAAYRSSVIDAGAGPRMPSVEAILHAVIYDETSVQVIAHTHPTAVNAILCSQTPELLVGG
ncbi:MAG: hypothetical protein F2892_04605, partial [Actinobacteria bacterium]|nr:hypothetical protein [Actinomycetota bacterium]